MMVLPCGQGSGEGGGLEGETRGIKTFMKMKENCSFGFSGYLPITCASSTPQRSFIIASRAIFHLSK